MTDTPLPGAPEPGSYDFNDPTEETRQKTEQVMRKRRLRNTESALMSTPGGREWVWVLMNSMRAFEETISLSGSDAERHFWMGKRDDGIRLLRRFSYYPEFHQMMVENDPEYNGE